MKSPLNTLILPALVLVLTVGCPSPQARANVYATNLKLNGSTNSPTIMPGQEVSIGYLLNEPASGGVTIRILSGTNVARTIALAPGSPGTSQGAHTVAWNGTDDAGVEVGGGDYAFSITAAATGHTNWTQISSDTNAGNQVALARGIAVNRNTNSAYYGRVFVANAYDGTGEPLGFHKLNADGSPAEEGRLSTGGYPWWGYPYYTSPFRVKVGADDRFYALDLSDTGVVLSWDQEITTNSMLAVLTNVNNPSGNLLSGFCVTGADTNRQLWMANAYGGQYGVFLWNVQPDGTVATTNTGTPVVAVGGDIADYCWDVDLDKDGRIYAVCQLATPSKLNYKVMRFPAYTNTPLLTADWKVDNSLVTDDPYAIAVNSAGTHVAVARERSTSVDILDANTGTNVATISSNGYPHYAVAWDNVGNVYLCFSVSDTNSIWQTWSPPGTNQAATYGLQPIHVLPTVRITSLVQSGTNLILTFTGPANYPPSVFTVFSGSVVTGVTNQVTDAVITGSGGVFQAIMPVDGSQQFYTVQMPTTVSWIYITGLRTSGGGVTLDFIGSASDPPSAFTVLSGAVPTGITNVAAATITGSGGVFQATVSASAPSQFYRIAK